MKQDVARPDDYGSDRRQRRRRPITIVLIVAAALVGGGVLAGTVLAGSPLLGKLAPEPLIQQGPGSTVVSGAAHLLPASWQAPRSGWLYVLDPSQLGPESQVLLVDPGSGTVKGVIRADSDPAMALSPDGRRLYLASRRGGTDTLSAIDTASGRVLARAALPFRWGNTLLPTSPSMAVSADGTRLYVRTLQTLASGLDRETVATFETATLRSTTDAVDATGCGASSLLASPPNAVDLVCLASGSIRSLSGSSEQVVSLPTVTDSRRDLNGNRFDFGRLAGGARSPDGKTVYGVAQDGRLTVVDSASRLQRRADLGIGTDRWVLPNRVSMSPDGTRLYVGVGLIADRDHGRADRILVVDTSSATVVKTFPSSNAFWTFALSRDGSRLYVAQPETGSIAVIDTATGGSSWSITGLGDTPALVLEAP